MKTRVRAIAAVAALSLPAALPAAEPPRRPDPLYREIASRLDGVSAIDVHTHLLEPPAFDPSLDPLMPLGLRSTNPRYSAALTEAFGMPVGAGGLAAAAERAAALRAERLARLGPSAYWHAQLDAAGVETALVNQDFSQGTDAARLRWVPNAGSLLYPLPADQLMARSPSHGTEIPKMQAALRRFLGDGGLPAPPPDLDAYLRFLDQTLARWREQGAVAIKFQDAYLRTLVFDDVPAERARALYAQGLRQPLPRADYLALQDHLARHLFLAAGGRRLPVHIHSSHGVPPFLRLQDADVRNLESVLTDPGLFGTQFVLIHGGAPLHEEAAYLGIKPHVWIDVSAMPFLYPVPELAAVLRKYLIFAPEKVLFGTDSGPYPGVPGGPEVQLRALATATREALYLALAGLVRDGVVDLETAAGLGRGVLRGNAARLHGWE